MKLFWLRIALSEIYIHLLTIGEQIELSCICSITKNMGLVFALNEGPKVAKGDFITEWTLDDIAEPERFKQQIEFLQNVPDIDAVGCWICEIDEKHSVINDKVEYPIFHNELLSILKNEIHSTHPTVCSGRFFWIKEEHSTEVVL